MRRILLLNQSVGLRAAILLFFQLFIYLFFPLRILLLGAKLSCTLKSLFIDLLASALWRAATEVVDGFPCALMGFSNTCSGLQ